MVTQKSEKAANLSFDFYCFAGSRFPFRWNGTVLVNNETKTDFVVTSKVTPAASGTSSILKCIATAKFLLFLLTIAFSKLFIRKNQKIMLLFVLNGRQARSVRMHAIEAT
jgi:hypothetical protein